MVYDAVRGETVLFGGYDGKAPLDDTWTWDGTRWTKEKVSVAPPARFGAAMAYDAARQEVVLFGGDNDDKPPFFSDTWIWNGSEWREANAITSPSARAYLAMTYDAIREEVVLFGGYAGEESVSDSSKDLADTWTWNGATWTRKDPANQPGSRAFASMAYDGARSEVVLFGGRAGGNTRADTWTWDGIDWREEHPQTMPLDRANASLTFDSARQEMVLFGGMSCSAAADNCVLRKDQMWTWTGTNWVQQELDSGPSPRVFTATAFDEVANRLVLFGGCCSYGLLSDTWTWDGNTWSRIAIPPSGAWVNVSPRPPLSPQGHSMVYDLANEEIVLFGGGAATWTWDGGNWTQLHPTTSPPERTNAMMAYDAARQAVVLFGGCCDAEGAPFGDTWSWDGQAWLEHDAPTAPPARFSGVMDYDAVEKEVVLYGGRRERSTALADTWTWDGSTWREERPENSPSARSEATMAYDAARQRMVLFGGLTKANEPLDDTWLWDGTNWSLSKPVVSPPARFAAAITYDSVRQEVVLFGNPFDAGAGNETWIWDGRTWVVKSPPTGSNEAARITAPSNRIEAAMVFDASSGSAVLFGGGFCRCRDARSTWIWDGRTWRQIPPAPRTNPPPGARGNAIAAHLARGNVVLYNAQLCGSALWVEKEPCSDTYTWDGTSWTEHHPSASPPKRTEAAMAYHAGTRSVVLFGGGLNNDPFSPDANAARIAFTDTWTWDGISWREHLVAEVPRPRLGHEMVFDAKRDEVVLFGGYDYVTRELLNDTWTWDGAEWTQHHPDTSPSSRSAHAMAYDGNRVVLFGGDNDFGGSALNDTWTWDGTTWTEQHPEYSPPARVESAMAYDSRSLSAVLFGGRSQRALGSASMNDTWLWDGAIWIEQDPEQVPAPRSLTVMAEDPEGGAVLFGGSAGNAGLNDTWRWRGLVPSPDPSADPRSDPSDTPTTDPSDTPTADPSETPTADPSETPTADPSESPSTDPSESPSIDPRSTTPEAPSNLTARAASSSRIELAWVDNSSSETGFAIERSMDGNDWVEIATANRNSTTHLDLGLAPDTTYFYRVRAMNTSGYSPYSNRASATTMRDQSRGGGNQQAPAAPTALAATSSSPSRIEVSWSDNSSNEDGFALERSGNAGSTWQEIATTGRAQASYLDSGLAAETTYQYRVRAYNSAGHSTYSNVAEATTQKAPANEGEPSPEPSESSEPVEPVAVGTATASMAASRSLTTYNEPFEVSGVVERDENCTGPLEVEVSRRIHGTNSYDSVASTTVNGAGHWGMQVVGQRNAAYVAQIKKTETCEGDASTPTDVLVRAKIAVRVPNRCGGWMRGKVLPANTGEVVLQRRAKRRWNEVATNKLDDRSRFAVTATTCGLYRLVWSDDGAANESAKRRFRLR